MSQSENAKKNYSEPELKAHGKISGLTQQVGGSGGFGTTTRPGPPITGLP
ncbi:MAG: hypothetical protein RMY29_008560 [Nostoc sp. CreGUA01]|nr:MULTISPECIES: hypothetical protein [Nostocales]MDZ8040825.1 hypothetical protein [Nostoc sp. CreGUA01]MDZ8047777.1 hypothetical protein [Nostoc sp. DedQUE02]MDZ7976174.1 hypothetical protein [Nostoc sp. DedQUE03]GAX39662.1 hypothetical protein NIES4075_06180 [Tolypothrix sp. NIES-4075]GAX39663.1 hypothetical protein NIES4075_06190 [Tolypothrix sp. NIES-4075]